MHSSEQPSVRPADVESLRTVNIWQDVEVHNRAVFIVEPRQKRYICALVTDRINLPTDSFTSSPDRPSQENRDNQSAPKKQSAPQPSSMPNNRNVIGKN